MQLREVFIVVMYDANDSNFDGLITEAFGKKEGAENFQIKTLRKTYVTELEKYLQNQPDNELEKTLGFLKSESLDEFWDGVIRHEEWIDSSAWTFYNPREITSKLVEFPD